MLKINKLQESIVRAIAHKRVVLVAACVFWGVALTLAAKAETLEELKQQRATAEEKLKGLNAKFDAAQKVIFKNADFAPLVKKVDDATKARDAKVASDPKAIEARKAASVAAAATKKISDEELAASPDAAEIVKQISAADESIDDLRSQERIANFIFSEVLRKAAKDPELKKFEQAQQEAGKAAAGKPADSAEKQAASAAKKAFDEAAKSKAAALPQGAEQLKKIEELQGKQKTAAEARKALDSKFVEVKKAVLSKSEKIAAARSAENLAMTEANKVAGEQAKAEKETLAAARKEYTDAQQAKLAADPAASALRKEIDDTQKLIRELAGKIRDAGKVAK